MLCRVFQLPGGHVAILYPNERMRLPGESDEAFVDRLAGRDAKIHGWDTLTFVDVDSSTLPADRRSRAKWEVDTRTKGVRVKA